MLVSICNRGFLNYRLSVVPGNKAPEVSSLGARPTSGGRASLNANREQPVRPSVRSSGGQVMT